MKEADARGVYIYDLATEIMGVFEMDLDVSDERYSELNRMIVNIVTREYVPRKEQA